MVAYSFQQRFVVPILSGTKRQTIRKVRVPPSRHARAGERMQLYYALRTKACRLLGIAVCNGTMPIVIVPTTDTIEVGHERLPARLLDSFACSDGFADWPDMRDFWREHHAEIALFSGDLILWRDMEATNVP